MKCRSKQLTGLFKVHSTDHVVQGYLQTMLDTNHVFGGVCGPKEENKACKGGYGTTALALFPGFYVFKLSVNADFAEPLQRVLLSARRPCASSTVECVSYIVIACISAHRGRTCSSSARRFGWKTWTASIELYADTGRSGNKRLLKSCSVIQVGLGPTWRQGQMSGRIRGVDVILDEAETRSILYVSEPAMPSRERIDSPVKCYREQSYAL
nr:hypothetical protein CFP56_68667 [Quercus suber]